MGQRHQIFVVARVCVAPGKPRQYRCIAAIHHQWCYGKLPLYAVNSFKHLSRVPDNATLIEEELATYHERIENSPEHPCPYTGYLAESAFSVDLVRDGGPYVTSSVSTLGANMGSRDGGEYFAASESTWLANRMSFQTQTTTMASRYWM